MPSLTLKGNNIGTLGNSASLTIAQVNTILATKTVNAQTGTTYPVVATDAGGVVTLNNASAITVTLSNVATSQEVEFIQLGAGQVTFVSGTLTLRQVSGLTKTAGQYARVSMRVIGTDAILCGDMA